MMYLIFSILSSTSIFIIFKFISRLTLPALPIIVLNYLFASVIGLLLTRNGGMSGLSGTGALTLAIITGTLFILMFVVLGLSTGRSGLCISTVAGKMSVVIPVTFSVLYDPSDRLTLPKIAAILAAMISVFLIVYRKDGFRISRSAVYLPVLLFLGMGLADTLVKYAQFRVIGDHSVAGYTALVFLASFVAGLTALLLKPGDLRNLAGGKVLFWGLMLGMANFGSVYFFIKALNHAPQTGILSGSSVVFTANNTGIVILSVLAGLYFFRERLSILNKIGILFSLASIALFYAV